MTLPALRKLCVVFAESVSPIERPISQGTPYGNGRRAKKEKGKA
jgi:hypothetical protein